MDLTELLRAVETEVGRVNHAAQVAEADRDAAAAAVVTVTAERDAAVLAAAGLTVDRDRLADSLAVVTADRDRLAAAVVAAKGLYDVAAGRGVELQQLLAAAETERDDARRRLAAAEARVAALLDRYEGRVPAGPVRALVAEVVGLATATGDPVIAARWQVFAAAALAKIAEAEPGGGVRRADPLIPILRQQVIADGLLAAADVDARLAAAGLV